MKVLIIIPHFGNWPPWFAYFLQTCEANPAFSWLIYSDCKKPETSPVNVKFIHKSLADFNHLASQKLNIKINISNPYKICDLRPSFGEIFNNYIEGFDFWGYSDLDLFYGNIKQFLTDEILFNHDLISIRKDYFSGHFALYRNTKTINKLYTKGSRVEKIFQDRNHHYAYDERSNIFGKRLFLNYKKQKLLKSFYSLVEKTIFKIANKIKKDYNKHFPDDITSIVSKEKNEGRIRYFAEDMVRSDLWFLKEKIPSWKINWKNSELFDVVNRKELLHFHIIKSKINPNFKIPPWTPNKGFSITENGISIFHQ
jgi:hypothetical protein